MAKAKAQPKRGAKKAAKAAHNGANIQADGALDMQREPHRYIDREPFKSKIAEWLSQPDGPHELTIENKIQLADGRALGFDLHVRKVFGAQGEVMAIDWRDYNALFCTNDQRREPWRKWKPSVPEPNTPQGQIITAIRETHKLAVDLLINPEQWVMTREADCGGFIADGADLWRIFDLWLVCNSRRDDDTKGEAFHEYMKRMAPALCEDKATLARPKQARIRWTATLERTLTDRFKKVLAHGAVNHREAAERVCASMRKDLPGLADELTPESCRAKYARLTESK